jgi:hypothetical protein
MTDLLMADVDAAVARTGVGNFWKSPDPCETAWIH